MLFFFAICLSCYQTAIAAEFNLPNTVRPFHYDVKFVFDIDPATNFSFYGVVNIWLVAEIATSKIILHAQNLDIDADRVILTQRMAVAPAVADVQMEDRHQFLEISLESQLLLNVNYTLTIPFYGNLRQGLDGIYISTYENPKTKKTEYVITSQFEPISARKGFPCFDEPSFKSTFRITIGYPRGYTALSNMPVRKTSDNNAIVKQWPWRVIQKRFMKPQTDFVWDHFMKTVTMSTYLVAVVVSKFVHVETHDAHSNTTIRIWARSDALDQTEYASRIAPKVLSYFGYYFGIGYILPKLDLVAVPDLSSGAMENWGLAIFGENMLLFDGTQSCLNNKLQIVEVIAHELAHQWFGNLVTMQWWSDLWLNEGFATQMAYDGMTAVEPSWNANVTTSILNVLSVFTADSLPSSRPVSSPLDDINQIDSIFDEIAYKKGAVLIRMMSMFLGEKYFRKAIHNYLMKYAYSNAEKDDLWSELNVVTMERNMQPKGVTIKEVMDMWTTQPGYPLLEVTRNYEHGTMTFKQSRYLALKGNSSSQESWWIPVSVLAGGRRSWTWVAPHGAGGDGGQKEHAAAPEEWLLINYDMMTLMRVNYDTRNWELLISALNSDRFQEIPGAARAQLLADAFQLAWSGRLHYGMVLRLANYLERETDVLPLKTGIEGLSKIENVLLRTKDYGAFQKYMRKLISKPYRRAGGLSIKRILNENSLEHLEMQVLTSEVACRMQMPGCEENAIELFQRWMDEPYPDQNNPIPAGLRPAVYCAALSRGGVATWRFAAERWRRGNVAAARRHLALALTCTPHVWLLKTYVEWCMVGAGRVRRQEAAALLAATLRAPAGYFVARDAIYHHLPSVAAAFSDQRQNFGTVIKCLLGQITTQRELDEFTSWSKEHQQLLAPVWNVLTLGIERARVSVNWAETHAPTVLSYMRNYTSDYEDPMCKEIDKSNACSTTSYTSVIIFTLTVKFL